MRRYALLFGLLARNIQAALEYRADFVVALFQSSFWLIWGVASTLDFILLKPVDSQLMASPRQIGPTAFPDFLVGAALMAYGLWMLMVTPAFWLVLVVIASRDFWRVTLRSYTSASS